LRGRKALISVSNKEGVILFAQELEMMGWEIISTGGTARSLRESGVKVKDISELTGFPEMLDGRVKTLHPKVHGGILGRRDLPLHGEQMKEQGIEAIDLVAVNLYPFPEVIARKDTTLEEAIENIDIGGPAMIRAAAKNYRHVIVVVEPFSYSQVVEELRQGGDISLSSRYQLAVRAFSHTAYYDSIISNYLRQGLGDQKERLFPAMVTFPFNKVQDLGSGENSQQKAAFYREPLPAPATLASGRQVQGKELSFNDINDLHVAWELAKEFEQPAAVVVKHANPCGVGLAEALEEACRKAFSSGPADFFTGGTMAFNREVDRQTAERACKLLPEAIAAPSFSAEALKIFSARKKICLLEVSLQQPYRNNPGYYFKKIGGGLLLREDRPEVFTPDAWTCATGRKPTEQEMRDLLFGLTVARHAKANAVAIVKRLQVLGLGSGQMDQLDSVKLAVKKAGQNVRGSVMASDARFLFKAGVEIAAAEGITAIVQTGGAKSDEEIIGICEKYNIAMLFTGIRSFRD
jgi:phosphoribosylaminoimidazolecarboxamide formyltransferase/IMP cyclohydrolase